MDYFCRLSVLIIKIVQQIFKKLQNIKTGKWEGKNFIS
jgi:hypothetical protein